MIYTHHLPGRLRVRTAEVKRKPSDAARLRAWLESIPGVDRVEVNPLTGSALVRYDPEIADGVGLLMLLEEEGWIPSATAPTAPAPTCAPVPRAKTLQQAVVSAIVCYIIETAIERSVIAIVAAIL